MQAIWKDHVIADSDDTVVEGNHHFPENFVRREFLQPSDTHTTCHGKGVAGYCDIVAGDAVNRDAMWFYPEPLPEARQVAGRCAFWKGVQIIG
jgi:uncharacterized protein (DUF427 family)